MGKWLYYHFPLEAFTQRNFAAYFIRLKLQFCQKTKKSLFEPHIRGGGVRCNVRTSSIARWKARDWLPIPHNWFFRYLLGLRRYKRKSVEVGVFRRGGSLWAQISDGKERRPPITIGVRKLEWLPFHAVVSKVPQLLALCDHNSPASQTAVGTDRQTSYSWH